MQEYGAVVDCPDIEGYTPLHRAVDGSSLAACKVLVALGAEVRLETYNKEWPYEMALRNCDADMSAFVEKALHESGPYPLEPEDDELSAELKLEEEARAFEEGGHVAAHAVWELEMSPLGRLKAMCRFSPPPPHTCTPTQHTHTHTHTPTHL